MANDVAANQQSDTPENPLITQSPKRLVGFAGRARSGKDTAARFLAEFGYTPMAFADEVRAMALDIDPEVGGWSLVELVSEVGWESAKQWLEVRRFLQRLGTEGIRSRDPDFWVRIAMQRAAAIGGPVVFTDVRFQNEAAAIRAAGGIVVRIDRPDAESIGANAGHASEVLDFEADGWIINVGTLEDLRSSVLHAAGCSPHSVARPARIL